MIDIFWAMLMGQKLRNIICLLPGPNHQITEAVTLQPWAPFYLHGLTLIPAWISSYMPSNMWNEITYPFLNFNGATVEV